MTTLQIETRPRGSDVARIVFVLPSRDARLSDTIGDLIVETASDVSGAAPRVLVSLGKNSTKMPERIRRAAGTAAGWLLHRRLDRAVVELASLPGRTTPDTVQAVCEGFILGGFQFLEHKTASHEPKTLTVGLYREKWPAPLKNAVRDGTSIAEATNLARAWGHAPPNVANPVSLAEWVRDLCRRHKLKCSVYDEDRLARMKAGGLLSVGMASDAKPRLIVVTYAGTGSAKSRPPVVLVGKAVTFDTGGYSIKDKTAIVGMKYDKCGGMAVIGAMRALADLKPKTPVIGIVPAAENMIAGNAYRPNDIITTMSGKTVEIISTDAEGRMILADALTFAQQKYKPRAIIDIATLTGGVVVALGAVRAGIFANDDKLAAALIQSGERVHERLWRLPLDDEYLELIKGDDSDIKNSAGRHAHPIIGGIFLKQFVNQGVPWAHLDIAGTATCDKDLPYCPKGATGFGVRLLVDYIRRLR